MELTPQVKAFFGKKASLDMILDLCKAFTRSSATIRRWAKVDDHRITHEIALDIISKHMGLSKQDIIQHNP